MSKIVYSNSFNSQAVLVTIAMLCLTADAMPFNAVGTPFYDGNVARAPSFMHCTSLSSVASVARQ